METNILRVLWVFALSAASMPAAAQYVGTPPPSQSVPGSSSTGVGYLRLEPKNGQSEQQQWSDRYDCHRWAHAQSGFDPSQPAAGTPAAESAAKAEEYRRAMTACLESRGYTVHYQAASSAASGASPSSAGAAAARSGESAPGGATSAGSVAAGGAASAGSVAAGGAASAGSSAARVKTYSAAPELKYHPLAVQIHGGYTATTGTTDRLLDDGANVGFGFTWFPSSMLPLGVRVDGSYSRFRARNALLDLYGGGFTSGHDNIYGGDVDLQLDLAHGSPFFKMYLLGGAGWYREQTYLRQETWYPGTICGWYYCVPGYVPVLTGSQRTTSPWHSSWNAGLGFEVATGGHASFFVEARYQRISTFNDKMQFVPIRMGLRF